MASHATPELRDLAIRLLAAEARNGELPSDVAIAAVCGLLGGLISDLAGSEGFRSLVARALALSRTEVTWLSEISIAGDGKLQGLECRKEIPRDEVVEGEVLLIAQILGLLGHFIGEPLVLQLVMEIWPGIIIQQDLASKARDL